MLHESTLQSVRALVSAYVGKLAIAAVVVALGLGIAWLARAAMRRLLSRRPVEAQLLAGRVVYIAVLVGTALWALSAAGVHIAAIATVAGTIGLATSLSLQGRAQDVVAGLYLLMERFFKVGDQVSLRGFSGQIEFIGSRTTLIRTADGKQLVVPNTVMMSEVIVKGPDQAPVAAPTSGGDTATS
jgi:small-conductance mechanosensitive channel